MGLDHGVGHLRSRSVLAIIHRTPQGKHEVHRWETPDGAPPIAPCDRTFPCAVVWHIYGTPYGYQRRCGSDPSRDCEVSACLRDPHGVDAVINAATRMVYPYGAVPAVQRMVVY